MVLMLVRAIFRTAGGALSGGCLGLTPDAPAEAAQRRLSVRHRCSGARHLLSGGPGDAGRWPASPLAVVLSSMLVGIPLGPIAGYSGGWLCETIMRVTDDGFLARPRSFWRWRWPS